MLNNTFQAFVTKQSYEQAVEEFSLARQSPIPVWANERGDLLEVVELADGIYEGVSSPAPAELGINLTNSDLTMIAGSKMLVNLAEVWGQPEDLEELLSSGKKARVILVGTYKDLKWSSVRSWLVRNSLQENLSFGFICGRDIYSLLWMAAKQWAAPSAEVTEKAFFSGVDNLKPADGVSVFSEADFETDDIQAKILSQPWHTIVFQGHGKDDNINLDEFTVCGLNPAIELQPGTLFPRCGYGQSCFKDENKLIPLRLVRSHEIILSACNSGPFSDVAHYDPKFILSLNAIDGCAQTIISAVGVHDSDAWENRSWLRKAGNEIPVSTMSLLNNSLRDLHPHPIFWHCGMPPANNAERPDTGTQSREFTGNLANRLQSYLVSDLLPPNYSLRNRLEKLNRKVNLSLTRSKRYENDVADFLSLQADIQSINSVLAKKIQANPEDDILNYAAYFGERSEIVPDSTADVICSCGNTAQFFERRGIVRSIVNTFCIMCPKCGFKEIRMEGAPQINCRAPHRIKGGEDLPVEVSVFFDEDGPAQIGIFVPRYLRNETKISPEITKLKGRKGQSGLCRFSLSFSAEVSPQAYYFTVYTVQNLNISTYLNYFGLET